MNKICVGLIGFLFLATYTFADAKKEQERVENSGKVIKEILDVPDNVPQDLLDKAKCVVVLPSVVSLPSASEGAMVAAS
jgi:lipid-binding SYLF domain-containing protein